VKRSTGNPRLDDGVGLPPGWALEAPADWTHGDAERIAVLHPDGQRPLSGAAPGGRRNTKAEIILPLRMIGEVAHVPAPL